MSNGDDSWGCLVFAGIAVFAGWYVWDKYEVRKRDEPLPALPVLESRPTGQLYVTELEDGTIWRLDADSVLGPREARQAWNIEDYTKKKNAKIKNVKTLYRINCNTTAYRVLSVVEYDSKGQVKGSWGTENFGDKDNYPPPDSVISSFVNLACGKGFDNPIVEPPKINVSTIPPPKPAD
ncbi:MAG: hypothetical protein KA329_09630 [Novosphingobium sp.]|nr:hypothetical protein [Novosphingobium sp.]